MAELFSKIYDLENLVCANKAKINGKVKSQNVVIKESDLEK